LLLCQVLKSPKKFGSLLFDLLPGKQPISSKLIFEAINANLVLMRLAYGSQPAFSNFLVAPFVHWKSSDAWKGDEPTWESAVSLAKLRGKSHDLQCLGLVIRGAIAKAYSAGLYILDLY